MLNKLIIGTAQLGLNYGINNQLGKVSMREANSILNHAYKNGISTLDTAFQYGDSETIIGKITCNKNWDIITKTSSINLKNFSSKELINNFHASLKKLKKKSIYGLLIHDIDLISHPDCDHLYTELLALKKYDYIKKLGFSVYTTEQTKHILKKYKPDIIQLPINIFNQEFLISGLLKKMKDKNIEIHARSIFLQGLLLSKIKELKSYFLQWENHFISYYQLLNQLSLSSVEACLSFVLQIKEIDRIIVGCQSLKQLKTIIQANQTYKIYDFSTLHNTEVNLTDPRYWKI